MELAREMIALAKQGRVTPDLWTARERPDASDMIFMGRGMLQRRVTQDLWTARDRPDASDTRFMDRGMSGPTFMVSCAVS